MKLNNNNNHIKHIIKNHVLFPPHLHFLPY